MTRPSRRHFLRGSLAVAGVGLLSGGGVGIYRAVQPRRLHRLGFLTGGSPTTNPANLEAFRLGLRELGHVEGRDVAIDARYAEGREERYPELAAELVQLQVDVIVTGGSAVIRAAKQATTTIPIVFAATGDPVAEGLVDSLRRTGGNLTGLTTNFGEEHLKRLKDTFPSLSRLAVLWNQSAERNFSETEAAAQTLGVQVLSSELQSQDELDTVLADAITGRADGLVVTGGPVFGFVAPRVVAWAAEHRLPAIYANPPYTAAGGLMIYAANIPQNYRRAATYVDKILKGAKPGDIPVEQPTAYDFVINLKTARTLGLTIPESVLLQATEIIQ